VHFTKTKNPSLHVESWGTVHSLPAVTINKDTTRRQATRSLFHRFPAKASVKHGPGRSPDFRQLAVRLPIPIIRIVACWTRFPVVHSGGAMADFHRTSLFSDNRHRLPAPEPKPYSVFECFVRSTWNCNRSTCACQGEILGSSWLCRIEIGPNLIERFLP